MPHSACRLVTLAFSGMIAYSIAARAADPEAPVTPKHEVIDTYHKVSVVDPYRWLENSADKQVHQWSAAQDKRTRQYLDGLALRKPIFKQLMKQISATSSSYFALHAVGNKVFAFFNNHLSSSP